MEEHGEWEICTKCFQVTEDFDYRGDDPICYNCEGEEVFDEIDEVEDLFDRFYGLLDLHYENESFNDKLDKLMEEVSGHHELHPDEQAFLYQRISYLLDESITLYREECCK